MSQVDEAIRYFENGFACSQAVFASCGPKYGIDAQTALKVSCGLGGGCGRLGLTCGAVTGAFLVIGIKYGKVRADDLESKEKTYAGVQEFSRKFLLRNKSLNCTELLGCDLGTPAGREQVKNSNLSATVCSRLVKDAVEIIGEMLPE